MFWSARKSPDFELRHENVSIHATAEISDDVEIGPFSVIGANSRIGGGTKIHNNVTIGANTIIGEGNEIFPGAVVGMIPQDKKYEGEESWVIIGDHNTIRECVTVNGGTRLGAGLTRVGNNNLLMASCHIAHDCILEDGITMANNVLLGGHVKVENFASFGGMAAVHHFVSVGQNSFIGGLARITQDVPPFMLVEGNPAKVWSMNKVGLRRHGLPDQTLKILKDCHRVLYRSQLPRPEAIQALLERYPEIPEVQHLVQFLDLTQKGYQGRARQPWPSGL